MESLASIQLLEQNYVVIAEQLQFPLVHVTENLEPLHSLLAQKLMEVKSVQLSSIQRALVDIVKPFQLQLPHVAVAVSYFIKQ